MKLTERCKYLCGAAQQPSTYLLHWDAADQIHRNAMAMRKSQFALRARAASGILVPVAENGITAMLDQVQVISNDLAHGLLEARKVGSFPCSKFAGFCFSQFFPLIFRRIIEFVAKRLKSRLDFRAPALALIRRIFNGTCKVEKHGVWRLSAIHHRCVNADLAGL